MLATGAASVALRAVPASAETLEAAVAQAFENNPSIEAERAFTQVADEGVTQAKSLYGPDIDVTVSHEFTYTRTHAEGFTVSDDGFATAAQIQLRQPLFTSGRLAANLDLAQATQMSQREFLRGASQDLVLNVVSAYVNLRRDIELYQVASDTYDILLQQRNLTASRLELRDATAPDVDQTQNRLELAAGRVIQARSSVEASAARYRNVVGAYPDTLQPLPALPQLQGLEELYAVLEANNPNVRAAQLTEMAARAQSAGARSELGPRVDATLTAGRTALTTVSNDPYAEQVIAGVTVSMPIYTSGRLLSQVREADARGAVAVELVEQARRDARESLTSNWNTLRAAQLSLPRFQAAVRAAQSAVSGVQQQQTAGIRTLRDVLDVTNDLFAARSAAAQAQADLYIAHASVLRDAGLLTADIFAPGSGYDPDSYSPGAAGLAGLPLRVILDPLDSIAVFDGPSDEEVQVEGDNVYEAGGQMADPLVPIAR